MQRALVGGLITVVATSVVGTWIVLRGLAFLADALTHGVVPGVAFAMAWGINPAIGAFVAALIMSGLVTVVSNRTSFRDETTVGLLFIGMLSLGVIVVSRQPTFSADVTALLFGDILGITSDDIQLQWIVTVAVVTASSLLYRPLLALMFNRDKAATLGMRPSLTQAALLAMLALSIVASYQAIGTLLVFGLLIGPPATAALIARRVPTIMALSMLIGACCVTAGLVASFHWGTAGGATITGLSIAVFFVVLIGREVSAVVQRRSQMGAGLSVS